MIELRETFVGALCINLMYQFTDCIKREQVVVFLSLFEKFDGLSRTVAGV